MVCARLFHTLLTKFYIMPLTKVTSSLINTISASQITATGATAGQVLTYNGSTSTWVASAGGISSDNFTGLNQSLSARGYQKLPGGFTIQWGTFTPATSNTTTTVTFPIAFATACYRVVASPITNATNQYASSVSSITTSNCILTNNTAGVDIGWVAIGY